jgi:hypothetical protein
VQSSRERRRKAEHFVRPATRCLVVIRTGVGILAKDKFDLSALKEDSLPGDLDAELLAREQAATYVQQTDG